jgi:purine-binding chemotaxis protein CheW
MANAEAVFETAPFLVFGLNEERFAVKGAIVREVVRAVAIASLPRAPDVVEGVINYRGRVVPVLDIRSRFGLPACPLHPDQHFIVADTGPRLVALRVDRAFDLLDVPLDAIESAAQVAPGTRHAEGIARLPEGLVVIHDLEGFLSLDEGARLDAAVRALGGSAEDEGGA